MHQTDTPIVTPEIEIRRIVGWIGDGHGNIDDWCSPPEQTHHDLGIEIHASADRFMISQQCCHCGKWIHPKAAHTVADLKRERFDPNPEMRDPPTDGTALGN